VRLTGTLMNLCLCLAWMQTVHIELSCVYPLIRVFMAVGFIWASRRCHSLDSGIVRDFRVDLVLAVKGALRSEEAGVFVDAIVGSIVGSAIVGSIVGSAIVGSIVGFAIIGSIVGSAISTLELSLFLFFPFSVVDKSAVAGTMIYMPLISFPVRLQEDGEVMEHFPFRNIIVCLPKSNWLIDRRESRKVGVWRAST
jgi:hypothetical protein